MNIFGYRSFILGVSLSLMTAKVMAQGQVEISSPEESFNQSLPGLGLLPREAWPEMGPVLDLGMFDKSLINDPALKSNAGLNPLLAPGIFAYQIDPISTFLAAGIILAIQSKRETGKVDVDAIWMLLNSTDLYAGWAGSLSAAITQRGAKNGLQLAARKLIPGFYEQLTQKELYKIFNNIIGGFTYTLSVSSGFEYFSQFWKLSTAGVEHVHTVSDLLTAPRKDILPVLQNLMNYVLDPNVQKRIASSVYNHRILTFEFIAMNIGMYLGIAVGDEIAKKFGPQTPVGKKEIVIRTLTDYFGRVLGGVAGGLIVQLTPDVIRVKVNRSLLDYKIWRQEKFLKKDMARIRGGIANSLYPPKDAAGVGSFFFTQMNLQSDVERVSRAVDMLDSLLMQKMLVMKEADAAEFEMNQDQQDLLSDFRSLIKEVGGAEWMTSTLKNKSFDSPEDWDRAVWKDRNRTRYQQHYSAVLQAGLDRFKENFDQVNDFIHKMRGFQLNAQASL